MAAPSDHLSLHKALVGRDCRSLFRPILRRLRRVLGLDVGMKQPPRTIQPEAPAIAVAKGPYC